jgi:hypothetical protein
VENVDHIIVKRQSNNTYFVEDFSRDAVLLMRQALIFTYIIEPVEMTLMSPREGRE